jgi:FkbM family methyltransferase
MEGIEYLEKFGGWVRPGTLDEYVFKEIRPSYNMLDIQEGDTVLDIGANIGATTIPQALNFPFLNFLCIEAHPTVFKALKTNIELNSLDNICCINGAVSNRANGNKLKFYAQRSDANNLGLSSLHLKGLGVDCISVDLITSKTYEIHKILMAKDMVMIENITNLDQISGIFTLQVLPLKIEKADGSPVRAIAIK